MISLLTSSLLLCNGMTTTFDAYLSVDRQNMTITGKMIDSDATHGTFDVAFDNLKKLENCLISDEIKLCFSSDESEATVEFAFKDQYGDHVEYGALNCNREEN